RWCGGWGPATVPGYPIQPWSQRHWGAGETPASSPSSPPVLIALNDPHLDRIGFDGVGTSGDFRLEAGCYAQLPARSRSGWEPGSR
ncbi:MAG TPA: hypothetical protein PLD50_25455, partial [Polyangiaceae bacterium]|nr:hypothetical protein [Polyangiaceae bacterium]